MLPAQIFDLALPHAVFSGASAFHRQRPFGQSMQEPFGGLDAPFVRNQIIMQTIGADGLGYLPYLTALFFFIFFSNITEIIPGVQFPANARFGIPLVFALATWVIYNVVGVVKQERQPSCSTLLPLPRS